MGIFCDILEVLFTIGIQFLYVYSTVICERVWTENKQFMPISKQKQIEYFHVKPLSHVALFSYPFELFRMYYAFFHGAQVV